MNTATTQIQDAIQGLKVEIGAAQLDLDAKHRSLEVLEGIYEKMLCGTEEKNSSPMSAIQPRVPLPIEDVSFNVDDLFEDLPKKKTLTDDIRTVVSKFGAQEFSISHIDNAMKKLGMVIAGKSPKSRISVSLTKLCEENFLIKTFSGSGNVPNKYRVKSTMNASERLRAALMKASTDSLQSEPDSDLTS